ncbi:MAG: MerR family transcriptional regulator [Desulfobacterales bacterium]|nr:MerR family transcriptional regulator [Desulfobacterales bacterium]
MQPTEAEIPEKRYFKIGEVSAITGLEPYVLRYWETEFPKINPARSRLGQRLYRKRDIEIILEIKDLLYRKRYTIAGAKQDLTQRQKEDAPPTDDTQPLSLEQLRAELLAIRDLLSR